MIFAMICFKISHIISFIDFLKNPAKFLKKTKKTFTTFLAHCFDAEKSVT